MSEIVKTCSKHGELTIEIEYFKKSNGKYYCRHCLRETEARRPKRKYEGAFAEYHREHARQWRQKNSDYVNEKIREDRLINPEKYREWEREQRNKDVEKSRYRDVLKKHKISADDYNELVLSQNNLCKICGKEETKKSRTKGEICRLALDHNHDTGKIRGLLCHHCNAAIGHLKEDIQLFHNAIEYLKEHLQGD